MRGGGVSVLCCKWLFEEWDFLGGKGRYNKG